jgi:CubicO group peptidase (beta-lactamase class C family)
MLLCAVLLLGIMPTLAQDDGSVYQDPDGRFSVPVPTNWTVEQAQGYAILRDPDEEITVYALAVESETIEDGVDAAWEIVNPDFDLDALQTQEVPSAEGVEETLVITYDTDLQVQIVQAYAQLKQGVVYVLIFDASIIAAQQRASQINIIAGGFTITAVEAADLSGVEPLLIDDSIIAQLETYIEEVMERFETPGLAVSIVQDGEVIYARGFGVTEAGGDQAVDSQTMMMIGSTTKSMTTMMMATLVDDGLMEWDTRVVDIMPTFAVADAEITQRITVRHLVCACTGVPRRDFEWLVNTFSPQGVIDSLADYEFFTDFGEAFQYSNQMVAAGGYVATLAAGGSYNNLYNDYLTVMQARVFDPIGMQRSTFVLEDVIAGGNYGIPHGANLDGAYVPMSLDVERILTPMAPAGALWSNVEDMAQYLITELNTGTASDGTQVVSAENLAVTWEPQVAVSASTSYGLGWLIDDYKGVRLISHDGNTLGFSSELAFIPDIGVGISVLSNQQASPANTAVAYRLFELIYQQDFEYDEALNAQLEVIQAQFAGVEYVAPDEDNVQDYLGRYHNDALGEVFVSFEDGRLMLNAGEYVGELRLQTGGDGDKEVYVTYTPPLAGQPIEFREEAAGVIVMVLGSGVTEYVFQKVN